MLPPFQPSVANRKYTPTLLEEENFLRQFLRSESGLIHPRIDLLLELIETAPQRTWERRHGRQHEAETGPQNSGISACAKEGDAESKVSEAVAVGLGDAFNQAVQAEAAQLIGHATFGELVPGLAA
jgi:hypothetical protein